MRFRLGDLVVDSARLTVERDGASVRVQPQVFDVLCYLAEHRDRVVSKEELLDEIWGDRFVSESALTSRVKSVRKLVGDDGVRQVVVKTFHGRGFRWVADIDVLEAGAPDRSALAAGRPPTLPTQMRPMPPPGLQTEALGRDQTVGEVTAAFSTRRLVTLIGPPGIGKTRVALEVLGRPHGGKRDVSFVELHTATSHNDILRLVRQAVGLDRGAATQSGQSEDAVERLLLDQLAHSQTPL